MDAKRKKKERETQEEMDGVSWGFTEATSAAYGGTVGGRWNYFRQIQIETSADPADRPLEPW